MSYRFDDKVVLITGAASGIGRATAQKLASLGATLAISDINQPNLVETNKLCGGKHAISLVDVGSPTGVNQWVEDTIEQYGAIHHVFNCAGVNPTSIPLVETTDEYYDKLMNTNLKGMFNVTRACIPHLKDGASFVNVSSISGLAPSAGNSIYCATKYGVIGFSKSMALELGPKGIRVNIVAPGYVNTPTNASVVRGNEAMERSAKTVSLGRMADPSEIADVVAFLFSNEARYMNGSVVEIEGGLPRPGSY
ncbi:NAD(P)-binding protein [Rhizodiscina lignyota]|uniref:NAD(P)-binding protein n=1 Tax=Rhizodiscina lignyota TaxID=1504668 RepID=A0A9P4IBU0_9PEZI|nr:NAD(P)-binding protein [Rhizodiscina lignyota]